MKLSIIIVNYNTKEHLENCITNIYKYQPSFPYEIICVDNDSKDGSREMLKSKFPQIKLITNKKNIGFARANNQAVRRAKGEFLLFLNPDAIPKKNAIENMVSFLEQTKDAGCVGPKLLNPDGSLQLSCRAFPTFSNVIFGRKSLFARFFPNNKMTRDYMLTTLDYNRIQKVDWIRGACIMTRKKLFEDTGLFDEDYFLFVEDTNFCYKLRKAGYNVYYLPSSVFSHTLEASVKKFWLKSTLHHNLGMYKFFIKNYKPSLILQVALYFALIIRVFYIITPRLFFEFTKK